MRQLSAVLVSNEELMPGVRLVEMETPEVASAAVPGQFVMVRCGDDVVLPRPFSIHGSSREKGRISLLFAVKGKGTRWLAKLRPEDRVQLTGPLGNGFSLPKESSNLLLVAGGIGVAPLVFLADEARHTHSLKFLLGATSVTKLYPNQLLRDGIAVITVTDDGSAGRRGLVSDVVFDYLDWADRVYICGPVAMYRAIAARLSGKKVTPPIEVSLEVRMGCGMGFCFGCTIKTKRGIKQVCRDGPVFLMEDVIWDSVVC